MNTSDVVIIGGGPGGSTLGCYLSMAGVSNTIIESAVHPRPHVGESMVTATTRVFREIGFLETMEREGFIRKYGASWHPAARRRSLRVEFAEVHQPGVGQDYTYQVDRARFDHLLIERAQSLGSTVHQGVTAQEVLFDEAGRATGVRARMDGRVVDIPARVVVDASGRRTLLGTQLGLKRMDPNFNQYCVHAWFEGVDLGDNPGDIHIHFLPVRRGWVWQIPITETVTSIGVVAEREVFRDSKGDPEGWFAKMSALAPDIAHAMRGARRVNEFKIEADYSYLMDRFVGDGWLLLGDAARFVDPIFSSGVSVAMHSAKFASERIVAALAENAPGRAALLPYEERLKRGTAIWYEFITLYYKLLPIFTFFVSKPEHRLQVVQLLQGEVYDRNAAPVLEAMRAFYDTVERTEGHALRPYLDPEVPLDEALLASRAACSS